MAEGGNSSDDSGASGPGPSSREARLAEALRQNLRRRKAQARARRQGGGEAGGGAAPDAADGDGD